jgi:hypothetical protein
MSKRCGRCKTLFQCRAEDIGNCECQQVVLRAQTRTYLQQTTYDCLCNKCLQELNELVDQAQRLPIPRTGADFKEGTHYYRDQGRWVMTEFYLLQRGYCCGNGCRHCAYGYQPR